MKTPQRSKIIQEVDVRYGEVEVMASQPSVVPLMELEDGRRVEAYQCDRFIREGTEGWAHYDMSRNVWKFTPDAPEEITEEESNAITEGIKAAPPPRGF